MEAKERMRISTHLLPRVQGQKKRLRRLLPPFAALLWSKLHSMVRMRIGVALFALSVPPGLSSNIQS